MKTEEEATGLRNRLQAGEAFEELAKKYSSDASASAGGSHRNTPQHSSGTSGETIMTELAWNKAQVLPPKGLLIAIASQLPLLLAGLPLGPSIVEVTVGAA